MTEDTGVLKLRIAELEQENEMLRQQQVEINKAKELYLKIFEDFPALIWRSRLDKLCDYFNRTWLEFTGRTMEQEFGNGWAEGVHPDDFDFCLKTYVEAFDKHQAFLMEYRMKNKFGEYRWIRDFGRPFYDLDDTFLGYIGSCYDITDIKETEEKLIRLNATKDKFFSIIAHDLRSPFSTILGYAELLNLNCRSMSHDQLEQITKQLYLLSINTFNLLENLLEWARTQTDKIPFMPSNLNAKLICSEIAEELASIASTKGIQIENKANDDISFRADVNMIKTVLRNLLTNAIKFTNPDGAVTLLTKVENDHIEFTVSGIGIQPVNQAKLFDITQIQTTPGTEKERGTGLGLILCKEFVEKHQGKIWVESTPGAGSNFKFTIPLHKR
jgi:two-component system CheB/CheR fusion protein